jgi:hypothetical protein
VTIRKEIIDAMVKGGMPEQEASALVRQLVEETKKAGWSDGYHEGFDEGWHQNDD